MTATATRKPYASAAEALSFPKGKNPNRIDTELDCECFPYTDILTAGRWRALDYHVKAGEHACAHAGKSKVTPLFCRCQVEPSPYLANCIRIRELERQLEILTHGEDYIPF